MKKNILYRLFAIVFFWLAWSSIKSERDCNFNHKTKLEVKIQSCMSNEQHEIPGFPYQDGFLIKI